MLSEVLLFSGVFALSVAAPGPDVMLLFGRALGHGPQAAVPVAVGLTVGKLVLLTLAALGVAAAATALGPLFVVIKLAGAAYLVWLGVRLLRRARDGARPAAAPAPERSFARSALTGMALTMSNPQAILFYVAVLPQVIDGRPALGEMVALYGALIVVMAVVIGAYLVAAARLRRALTTSSSARADRIAGVLLVTCGVWVAAR